MRTLYRCRTRHPHGASERPLIRDMTASRTNRLDQDKLLKCLQCGAAIFDYGTPSGSRVALDNAPGPYLIDANGVAYRSDGTDGYRGHAERCAVLAASPLTGQVDADDFLWV